MPSIYIYSSVRARFFYLYTVVSIAGHVQYTKIQFDIIKGVKTQLQTFNLTIQTLLIQQGVLAKKAEEHGDPTSEGLVGTPNLCVLAGALLFLSVALLSLYIFILLLKDNNTLTKKLKTLVECWKTTYMIHEDRFTRYYFVNWGLILTLISSTSLFLLIAGFSEDIQVHREWEHLKCAICVSISLAFCSACLFVLSKIKDEFDSYEKVNMSFYLICVAWLLVVVGFSFLSPFTIPGEQRGLPLFCGVSYGALSGWLLHLTTINYGVLNAMTVYPDGNKGSVQYEKHGKFVPLLVAVVSSSVGWLNRNPLEPVATAVMISFSSIDNSGMYKTNTIALLIAVSGCVISTLRIVFE